MATHPGPGPATPALVGREREQTILREALAAALAGRGALVLIGGEAGIGKTALAEWLLAEATAQGALVLTGRCYDLSETPPYGPWRELFARAPGGDGLPALPLAVLPPERDGEALASQEAIVGRVRAYLAALAGVQSLVLLLDDLHWADPASLDLLRALARHLADVPLLVLVTYRADEVADVHPLAALLPLLVREARATRLDLRPLDRDAIGALVAARYALGGADHDRLVGYLAGRTEGNALFLGEVLQTLEGGLLLHRGGDRWGLGDLEAVPVPALLRQVIAGRVHRLAPETARLLAVAAVLGQAVPFAVWAAVGEVAEGDLLDHAERAIAARLLAETPDGAGVRFAHALIREALYEGLGALRRPAWHRKTAEVLAALPQPDPDAVAYHFQRAGDPRAAQWLIRAGLRAQQAGAKLSAAARFAAAAALLAADPERTRERGWLLFNCGRLVYFADGDQALGYFAQAAPLAARAGDPILGATIRLECGRVRAFLGEVRLGLAEMERAVADLEALLPADDTGRLGADLALAHIVALLPEHARPLPTTPSPPSPARSMGVERHSLVNWFGLTGRYREALALGDAFFREHPQGSAAGLFGRGHAHAAFGQPEEARRAYGQARAALRASGAAFMVEWSLWVELHMVTLPYQGDAFPGRARLAAEAAAAWERAGELDTITPHASFTELLLALVAGRWAWARAQAEAALAAPRAFRTYSAILALGLLGRWQGAPDLAWAQVRALHPDGPATEPGDTYFPHAVAAQVLAADLALDAGDRATAGAWIAAHGRWLAWSGAVLWRADQLLLQARHARAAGDLPTASLHAEAALAQASAPRQPFALLAAHRLLGELATDAGHFAEATPHLDAALALADACAVPYERALTLLALAELHVATAERAQAETALGEARALLEPLGAAPALARATTVATRLAAPVAPGAPVPAVLPFGLTAREAEVLALVAAGLSDAAVAERLFLSRFTVKAHMRAVYGKLGTSSRTAAARLALDHGLAH